MLNYIVVAEMAMVANLSQVVNQMGMVKISTIPMILVPLMTSTLEPILMAGVQEMNIR